MIRLLERIEGPLCCVATWMSRKRFAREGYAGSWYWAFDRLDGAHIYACVLGLEISVWWTRS